MAAAEHTLTHRLVCQCHTIATSARLPRNFLVKLCTASPVAFDSDVMTSFPLPIAGSASLLGGGLLTTVRYGLHVETTSASVRPKPGRCLRSKP